MMTRKAMTERTISEKKEARRFALILAAILGLLGLLALWKHHSSRAQACLAAAMLAPVLAYLAYPAWIRFFRAWTKFAEVLGWVMTRIILTLFFYALLTPYGLVARLFRKDPLDLSWKRRKPGYWIEKPMAAPERERYERQY
jgi:cation transport ATPase